VIVKSRIVTIDTPKNMKSIVQGIPVIEALFDSPIDKSMTEDLIATRRELKIIEINTVKPGLEDAFVKLTGVKPEVMKLEKEKGGR